MIVQVQQGRFRKCLKYNWIFGDFIAIGLIVVFNYGVVFPYNTCNDMYRGGAFAALGVLFALRLIAVVVSCATVCMANCYTFQLNGIMLVKEFLSCYIAVCICDMGLCIGGIVVIFMDSNFQCFHSAIGIILVSSIILLAMVIVCRLMMVAVIYMSVPVAPEHIGYVQDLQEPAREPQRRNPRITIDTSNIGSNIIAK